MEPWKLLPVADGKEIQSTSNLSGRLSLEGLPLEVLENGDIVSIDGDESIEEEEPSEIAKQDQFLRNMMKVLKVRASRGNVKAHFLLGQLYFEQELYKEAKQYFEKVKDCDLQGLYQLGVIYYDGLGTESNVDKGFECLIKVASTKSTPYKHLIHVAQYCIGLAYFQGYGIRQSDEEAEKWWILAADDGHPKACVKAQSMLGMFYSLPDHQNFKRAFFWHTEACGNGNLESQGCLGVMHKYGIGVSKNKEAAFICLKEASARGNVYAMGVLVAHYYDCKMYTSAIQLASSVSEVTDFQQMVQDTDCIFNFIRKGVSIAAFYLGRCLERGAGVQKNISLGQKYYMQSFETDPQMYCDLVHRKHHMNV